MRMAFTYSSGLNPLLLLLLLLLPLQRALPPPLLNDTFYTAARALIDIGCTMTLDESSRFALLRPGEGVAGWRGQRHMITLTPGAKRTAAHKRMGQELKITSICEAADTGAEASDVALYTQATTADYIGKANNWVSFVNKYCFAKRHHLRFFLWFGMFRKSFTKVAPGTVRCDESRPAGNHLYRPIAVRAILEGKRHITWLVMMDMDAFFHPNYFETNSWGKFLSTEADIVAGAPSYSVLVTSALLAFKNTTTTHELFSLWVANRCGKKDQLPLWNSLFLLWRSVIPDLEWDEALMARYNTARSHALTVANKALKSHSFAKYQRTGVLNTVQHFPFMDLHPNIGHDLMLLCNLGPAAVANRSAMVCHSKCHHFQRCGCWLHDGICELPKQCR
mmetsp:Transcript_10406/g.27591  ORF Transcript_10406/g.27591 Transcript_10406/m.27591 type:complete len:392 (+) Transcript_10406:136-1311(+)